VRHSADFPVMAVDFGEDDLDWVGYPEVEKDA
jgi:hypothetical protein